MVLQINNDIDILNELKNFLYLELVDFIHISSPGSSGSRVYLFKSKESKKTYALKYGKSCRISMSEEEARNRLLKKYLPRHVPSVLYNTTINDYQVMISECPGANSLYNEILYGMKPHEELKNVWHDVLTHIGDIWLKSKTRYFNPKENPRNFENRLNRIKNGVLTFPFGNGIFLDNFKNHIIQVNGVDYCTPDELFSYLEHIEYPDFSVFCHGDLQPTNIVLTNQNAWYLVDWEWTGYGHDWHMMFAHTYGWWGTRMVYLNRVPTMSISGKRIIIQIDEYVPNFIHGYQKVVVELFNRISNKTSYESDIKNINKYLSLLYLGDIRFLHIWERLHYAPQLLANAVKVMKLGISKSSNSDIYYLHHNLEGSDIY